MYLFKKVSNGEFVFGPNIDSLCPAGQFRIEPSLDRLTVSIFSIQTGEDVVNNKPISSFKNESDTVYADFAALSKGYEGFFAASPTTRDLLGGWGDKVNPVGVAKYSAPSGYYFYACNCRIDGSKIASLEKNVAGVVSADATDSYIGVAMYQGEFHPFVNRVVSVTLTNATDQLQYWLKPL